MLAKHIYQVLSITKRYFFPNIYLITSSFLLRILTYALPLCVLHHIEIVRTYFDVDSVCFGNVGSEGDQTASSAQHLDVIRDFTVVNTDFQLSFSSLGRVHCNTQWALSSWIYRRGFGLTSELTRLSHDAVGNVAYSNEGRVVGLSDERGPLDFLALDHHFHHVRPHFWRHERHFVKAIRRFV